MDFNEISFGNLPNDREGTFIDLERQVRQVYEQQSQRDKDINTNEHGLYTGEYEPERTYMSAVIAFLDELNLEVGILDTSGFSWDDDEDFRRGFMVFKQKINYAIARFKLRNARIESGNAGTPIMIHSTYKEEIGKLLETIRKIVNQEVTDVKKKDRLFVKISALQLEIDRDQTTIDALFGVALDLTKTIGECAENLGPLIDRAEQVKKLIWDHSRPLEALPSRRSPKLLEDQSSSLDDEVPF